MSMPPGLHDMLGSQPPPEVLGPMGRKLLLALMVAPPVAYGTYKGVQHLRGEPKEEEEASKEASFEVLRRYGLV